MLYIATHAIVSVHNVPVLLWIWMNCIMFFRLDFMSLNSKGMFSRLGPHKFLLLLHVYTNCISNPGLFYCALHERLDVMMMMSPMFSLSAYYTSISAILWCALRSASSGWGCCFRLLNWNVAENISIFSHENNPKSYFYAIESKTTTLFSHHNKICISSITC